jgi:hypothetical protein
MDGGGGGQSRHRAVPTTQLWLLGQAFAPLMRLFAPESRKYAEQPDF